MIRYFFYLYYVYLLFAYMYFYKNAFIYYSEKELFMTANVWRQEEEY